LSGRAVYSLEELQAFALAAARDLYGDSDPWTGPGRAWAIYKTGDSAAINARLRVGAPPSTEDIARTACFGPWRLEKDAVVYRGVKSSTGGDPYPLVKANDIITDLAYLSTSYARRQARNFGGRGGYLMTITAPRHAAFVSIDLPGDASHLRNRELTFPPGSKLYVQDIERATRQQTRIAAVLLPPGASRPPALLDLLSYAENEWEAWSVSIES
jgi:hypothetical protein